MLIKQKQSLIVFFLLIVSLVCVISDYSAYETTISEIQDAIVNKNVKCSEIIQAHYNRIKLNDRRGAQLNSIISINPKAIIQAKQYDNIKPFGKLFCVPVIAKDNFDFENQATTAGCAALETNYAENNSYMIQKLIDEGAIILAKANMAELALQGLSTISTVIGKTLNAYTPNRTTYGSSGGTATAITASFGVIGLGTDTDGSIVLPSSAQYLYGLRPNKFRSQLKQGVFPLDYWQDIGGLIIRNIEDLDLVWSIFNSTEIDYIYNTTDTITTQRELSQEPSTSNSSSNTTSKLRLGFISDSLINYPPIMLPSQEVIDLTNQFLSELSNITELAPVQQYPLFLEGAALTQNSTVAQGFCYSSLCKKYINLYLQNKPNSTMQSVQDMLDSQVYSQYFSNGFLNQTAAATADDIENDKNCSLYQNAMNSIRDFVLNKMSDNNLDLIIYPTANQVPPLLSQVLPEFLNFDVGTSDTGLDGYQAFSIVSAYSGLPTLNIPIGQTSESKSSIGMLVLGTDETALIEFAKLYNKYYNKRVECPIK